MNPGAVWLRERFPSAPPRLLEVMLSAVPDDPDVGLPEALAEGALTLYEAVTTGSGGRSDALDLLAADGLFTHAFQAKAEQDPGGLAAFATRWGASGRLAELAR